MNPNRASAPFRADPGWRRGPRERWRRVRRTLLGLVLAGGVAAASPAGAQQGSGPLYGPVAPEDTLWELALRFRGDAPVTAHQAMIAILRANPDAFGEGNINALRRGATLRVPSVSEMSAIAPDEAVAEFARHEEAWRNRGQTGTAAPAPLPGAAAPADPPAVASPPLPPAASPGPVEEEGGELLAELAQARATIAELRQRLAERDAAIEEILVQLAETRQRLEQSAQTPDPGPAVDEDGESAGAKTPPPARALPVDPLVLGSALIVLLVLVVVVTLIRRREPPESGGEEESGGADEEDVQEDEGHPHVDPGEESSGDQEVPGRGHDEEPRADDEGAGGEDDEEAPERRRGRSRPGRRRARTVAESSAPLAGAGADGAPEDEAVDLPFGLDLEGRVLEEEDGRWEAPSEEGSRGRQDTQEPAGFGRHVEVGELDDLDIEGDSERDRSAGSDLPLDVGGEEPGGRTEPRLTGLPPEAAGEEQGTEAASGAARDRTPAGRPGG